MRSWLSMGPRAVCLFLVSVLLAVDAGLGMASPARAVTPLPGCGRLVVDGHAVSTAISLASARRCSEGRTALRAYLAHRRPANGWHCSRPRRGSQRIGALVATCRAPHRGATIYAYRA